MTFHLLVIASHPVKDCEERSDVAICSFALPLKKKRERLPFAFVRSAPFMWGMAIKKHLAQPPVFDVYTKKVA